MPLTSSSCIRAGLVACLSSCTGQILRAGTSRRAVFVTFSASATGRHILAAGLSTLRLLMLTFSAAGGRGLAKSMLALLPTRRASPG